MSGQDTSPSGAQNLLSIPGQASSRDASSKDAGVDSATTTTSQENSLTAKSTQPPAAKRVKQKASDPGISSTGGDDDSQSSGAEEGEEPAQVTAAEKEGLPPPQKGGTLAPKGYSMNAPPEGRPIRVYADGVFDLFHLGHMRQLEQAKTAFPDTVLLVGIPNDIETHKRKGLTVLTDKERAETLRHCKWVDEVIEDAPWIVTPDFLEKHKIDYVAHDDEPYAGGDSDDIYKPIKEKGKFLVTQRTEGISTTYIITKIVRDYEKYISRQLKRGTPRQELNVSWLKKNEIDIKRHVFELRDSIKTNWSTTGKELRDELGKFWAPSPRRPGSPSVPFMLAGNSSNPNLSHLDITRSASPHTDFATGYSLGLMNGVRSWITTRATSARGSKVPSPAGSDVSDDELTGAQSPLEEKGDPLHSHGSGVQTKS